MKIEKYITDIEESQAIPDEDKLIALCQIDLLKQGCYPDANYVPEETLGAAFVWNNTPSEHDFWSEISKQIKQDNE